MTLYQLICCLTATCGPHVKMLDKNGRPARLWWVERLGGVILSAEQPTSDADELK